MWFLIIIVLLIVILLFICNELIRCNIKCLSNLSKIDEDIKKELKEVTSLIKLISNTYPKEVDKLKEYLNQNYNTIKTKSNLINELNDTLNKLFKNINKNKDFDNNLSLKNIEFEIEIINKRINSDIELYNESAYEFNNLMSKKVISNLAKILKLRKKQLFKK